MIGHWIAFSLIFISIPFCLSALKVFNEKHRNFIPTKEQNRETNLKMAKYTLFYWMCDIFYLASFNNLLVMQFIAGLIIMIIIFYNVTTTFISSIQKNTFLMLSLIQDFIIGIFFSIYLINMIPNIEIKNIVIPIVSAIYGGLLTLVGVAWTIRWTKEESYFEHKNIIRPFIYPCLEKVNNKNICTKYFGDYNSKNELIFGYIKNSDKIEFIICSIIVNETEYHCIYGQGVSKNDIMVFNIGTEEKISDYNFAILKTKDEDGNENFFKLIMNNEENDFIRIVNVDYIKENELTKNVN